MTRLSHALLAAGMIAAGLAGVVSYQRAINPEGLDRFVREIAPPCVRSKIYLHHVACAQSK